MRKRTDLIVLLVTCFIAASVSFAAELDGSRPDSGTAQFPSSPDPKITPGSLCQTPNAYRYPEKIAYCSRDVKGAEKDAIIHEYDADLGYSVAKMDRQKFKIDHYFPLCMGGSNNSDNLWPQHESIYALTDPLEPAVCGKMAKGVLKQAEAVELIKRAKANPADAPNVTKYVLAL